MIKLLLLFALCFACDNSSAEYGSYMLGGTRWVLTDAGDRYEHEHFIEYNTGTITHTHKFYDIGETISTTNVFYFTPTYPTEFNPSLIGQATTGKYMVEYSNKRKTYKVFEIMKLTGDSLILRYDDDPKNYIGGFEPIRKYKRVIESNGGKIWR